MKLDDTTFNYLISNLKLQLISLMIYFTFNLEYPLGEIIKEVLNIRLKTDQCLL